MTDILSVIKESAMLDEAENQLIEEFHNQCADHAKRHGIDPNDDEYTVDRISSDINLSLYELPKEGIFIQAAWVLYLSVMRNYLNNAALKTYKYSSLSDFHKAYNDIYTDVDIQEQEYLWHTANWMAILFSLIPARKNKGLAMQIVPKLVEGWHTKYVTGSGQTKATASRVHIFETEGEVQANHRGGRSRSKRIQSHRHKVHRTKKPIKIEDDSSNDVEISANGYMEATTNQSFTRPNSRKRKLSESTSPRNEDVPVSIYLHPINASKYRSHLAHLSSQENRCDLSEATDADNDSFDGDDISSTNNNDEVYTFSKSFTKMQNVADGNLNQRRRTEQLRNQPTTIPILDMWMKPSGKLGETSTVTQPTTLVRGNSLDCSINGWTFDPYLDFDSNVLLDLLL